MTKYKDLSQEDKEIRDYYEMKWVRMMMFSMFLILGVWMLISPEKPEHKYIEKVTVSLFKDLWGIPFGIILLSIWVLAIAYLSKGIFQVRDYAWIRLQKGYYLYKKRRRISGLSSVNHGKDLLVFHPENNLVLSLSNYKTTEYHKYLRAKPTDAFNNDDIYWSADDNGYTLIYKGVSITDTTSEFRGDDLYAKSPSKFITVKLIDYRNSKDNVVRKANLV